MKGKGRHLDRNDLSFYLTTIILLLATVLSIIAGIYISQEVFFILANIFFIILTVYLVAVAQIEWKKRGGKWW